MGFFVKEALRSVQRNSVPSFAAMASILVTVLVLGIFIPITQATTGAANEVRDKVLVNVYLKAGAEKADRDRLAIWFGGIRVASEGMRDPAYDETSVAGYMKGDAIDIRVAIGVGEASATVWTCDLTKEYVAINGDYRS